MGKSLYKRLIEAMLKDHEFCRRNASLVNEINPDFIVPARATASPDCPAPTALSTAPIPDSPASPDCPAPIGSPSPTTPTPFDDDMTGYNSAMSDDNDVVSEDEGQRSDKEAAQFSSSSEGFTPVKGSRKRSKRQRKEARAAKKQAIASAGASDAPTTETPTPIMATQPTARPASPKPGSQPAATAAPRAAAPPPLYIHDKDQWTNVSKACALERINYTHARPTAVGIKVQVPTSADFRSLTRLLKERKVSYHTYALSEERQFRCVIKRVPKELRVDEITEDLKSQSLPILEVHRMHRGRNGAPYDMILVVLENTAAGKSICDIKSVCHLSGIKVERPYKNALPGQCHNCQLYGHAQRHCYARARCVKCLGDHATADCARPKDLALCTEPPSCVLCGESGHPASYRGCPRAPRAKPQQQRTKLPQKSPGPIELRPQRASPWNLRNHQEAFPALKPTQASQAASQATTPPPLMAHPIPVPAVPTAPRRPPLLPTPPVHPHTPQPAPYNPSTFDVLARFFNPRVIARSNELHAKLVAARGNIQANMALMSEYADLSAFYLSFTP